MSLKLRLLVPWNLPLGLLYKNVARHGRRLEEAEVKQVHAAGPGPRSAEGFDLSSVWLASDCFLFFYLSHIVPWAWWLLNLPP